MNRVSRGAGSTRLARAGSVRRWADVGMVSAVRVTATRAALLLALLLTSTQFLAAQSLLERPPNMQGTWIGTSGTLHFHFMHRFEATDAPTRKVLNSPTFLLATGLPARTMVGALYATNSVLVSGFPNEWEFFGRYSPLAQQAGAPVDLSLHAGYNQAARSWDGEVAVARNVGPVRLLAAARGFSAFRRGDSRWAVAGGASVRLNQFVALSGDVASLIDRRDNEDIAWAAGLQLGIPYTPHTLSLHVSNTHTTTLEGASIGTIRTRRWGFEFTVPVTLSRYFGGRRGSGERTEPGTPGEAAAEVTMTNTLRFEPETVRIRVGETIRWRNTSDVVHTVTADPALAQNQENVRLPEGARPFNSGDMLPGDVFTHTFTVAGEYTYFCIPHELAGMVAKVIVEE